MKFDNQIGVEKSWLIIGVKNKFHMNKKPTFKELINGDQPILIDFFATWCGPCMGMNPALKEVAKNISGKGRLIKIDVDKNPKMAAKMGVMGVPTFMLYKNGEKLWHEAGTKTVAQLTDVVLKNI